MKVKKYVGETIQDTIFKVKAELGSEAIILNTRKYKKGGFMGLFAKKQVEVLAALEENKGNQRTLQELENLKSIVKNMNQKWKSETFAENLPEALASIYHHFKVQGIDKALSREFIEQLRKDNEGNLELNWKKEAREGLKNLIGDCQPVELGAEKKVVLLAGPTGAGKTTTVAKMAAKFSLEENKKVGLITADTYRIAAVQQLRTYSDILNIPLKVVYNEEEFSQTLQEDYGDYDLILVDTAGSSWNDRVQLGRLKKFANYKLVDEVHLLISLNTKTEDIETIMEHFSLINPDKLILSKLDETNVFGDIINIQQSWELPYSYITFGQDVPDDIREAKAGNLAEYVLGDYNE